MAPAEWETRELAPARWEAFESLFRPYGGVQAGCWCMFYHRDGPTGPLDRPGRAEENRRAHHDLLRRGHANGILVYHRGAAVGWCQFGRRADLPRIEHGRRYAAEAGRGAAPPAWRITCFFVDRPYRRKGVAARALHAALEAIAGRGGGVVEAYPATHARAVALWFGTVGMFSREGFLQVRPFGQSHLLMRRTVAPRRRPRPPRARRRTGAGTAGSGRSPRGSRSRRRAPGGPRSG